MTSSDSYSGHICGQYQIIERKVYRVFRNSWELIVRLKESCLRLSATMNFINRANSGKIVLPGIAHSIFVIIIIGMKKTVIVHSETSTYGQE